MDPDRPDDSSPTDFAALTAAVRSIAPDDVDVGCRRVADHDIADLHPIEVEIVRTAQHRRRSEFATGRVLLREMLGIDVAIPREPRGNPRLPSGVRASIAHDAEWAVGAISRAPHVTALGIDLEADTVLDPTEVSIIVGPDDEVTDPLLTFVQKEAIYKAWSALGGRILEHHDVTVRSGSHDFSGEVVADGTTFVGRHTVALQRRLALVVVRSG